MKNETILQTDFRFELEWVRECERTQDINWLLLTNKPKNMAVTVAVIAKNPEGMYVSSFSAKRLFNRKDGGRITKHIDGTIKSKSLSKLKLRVLDIFINGG